MVTAHGAGQAGSDRDHHHLSLRKYTDHDRNQDAEGSPGCAGRKSKQRSHKENDHRQKALHRICRTCYEVCDENFCAKQICHAG